ncbi:MAG TPA: hypothetical protein VEX62_02740 [Candidatus Limnocylindrales bacterium]|nr:hypothetical protein [Candidatus Limnocylindrales bacterium]
MAELDAPSAAAPAPPATAADAAANEGSDSATRAQQVSERMREPLKGFLTLKWVPLTAALLSLVLSVAAIYVSTRQPDVLLILPDQIRVAQGRETGSAYVYLQPAFVSTGANERVEVIRDMILEVTSPSGERTSFSWDQELRLVTDPDTGALNYEYVADAVPILVGPRDAAAPLSLFDAPHDWFFAPGSYTFAVAADRVVVGQPLSAQFSLTLTPENIAFLDEPGPDRFLTFPIE